MISEGISSSSEPFAVEVEGRQTWVERPVGNQRLTEVEELAVCIYLKRLDAIGACARLPMITSCANEILRKNDHVEYLLDPPPTVSTLGVGAS